LRFTAAESGRGSAELEPGDYYVALENGDRGAATPPADAENPVVDITVRIF
jgi:hypothetical protein